MLRHDDRILIARRATGQRDAGLWELPGGKVEAGEAFEAALKRELAEELQIQVEVGERLGGAQGTALRLTAFAVDRWVGEPVARVHDALLWTTAARSLGYPMPALDVEVLHTLLQSQPHTLTKKGKRGR